MRGTPERPGGAARAGALSDLALGLVTLVEARRLARTAGVRRAWASTFGVLRAGSMAATVAVRPRAARAGHLAGPVLRAMAAGVLPLSRAVRGYG